MAIGRMIACLESMDDKSKTRPQDALRVNVNEDYEVDYWSGKFGCTREELKAAVKRVGVMAKDVQQELSKKDSAVS
jgi:hypothetical protein